MFLSSSLLLAALVLPSCTQDYEVIPEPPEVDPGDVTECGFTRVADTFFYAYDCNPVFTSSGEAWAPTISATAFNVTRVLDHPFYQIWYTGMEVDGAGDEVLGSYGIGYAISAEGTEWRPNSSNPLMIPAAGPGSWDNANMDALQVIWDPGTSQYLMLYQGYDMRYENWGLGAATSPDGVAWTKLPSNPVINLNEPSIDAVSGWCWPLGLSLGQIAGYTGYIAGAPKDWRPSGREQMPPCQAYAFKGSDPATWNASPEVVLPRGADNTWDDEGQLSVSVAELEGTWYMFYAGFGDWEKVTQSGSSVVYSSKSMFFGVATSPDGETWTKESGPVPLNTTADGQVQAVHAYTVGPRIHLWVTDDYDGIQAVGYFLYDPHREDAAAEDTAP